MGKINKRGSSKLLVIHSKKLSDRIIKNKHQISVKNHKDGLIITLKGEIHVTIAAKKRLQIAITKLIKNKKISIKDLDNVPIYLEPKEWGIDQESIFLKSMGDPITDIIPKNLKTKNAAIRPNKNKFYLDISSKKLYEIAKKQNLRCLFNRLDKSIILIRSTSIAARRLTPHSKKRIQIATPKEILDKKEIIKIKEKGWLPIKLKINLTSFGLEIKDFYSIKEEKELVEYLSSRGEDIKIKRPSDPYDILLIKKKIAVEVHNSFPRKGDLVTRHKIKPGMIRLRILEADFLIKNKKLNEFYVIIHKKWENGKYIKEISNHVHKKVNVLFTDFKNKWYEKIGKKLLSS